MTRILTSIGVVAFAASIAAQSTPVHRSYDIEFLGAPLADPVLQHAKETFVLFGCAYCHGLNLVSRGLANKEVARALNITEKTVKHYMTNIMQKLHVRNRVEAALAAQKIGASPVSLKGGATLRRF